jgi:hypothetical protein
MQYLNKYQKELVDLIVKQSGKKIDLIAILQKYLPKDLYIGNGDLFGATIWYSIDQIDYVHTELTVIILDFVNLINELTTFNYLTRIKRIHLSSEELKIGEKVENNRFVWFSLRANLSYTELEKFFLEYEYFQTESLKILIKHNYKQPEEFRADRHLFYLMISVFCSLATAIISLVALLISRFLCS